MKRKQFRGLYALLMLFTIGCQPVKPYQRVYLNDHEMRPQPDGAQVLEENMQTYREGAVGGGGTKGSGGCGCN